MRPCPATRGRFNPALFSSRNASLILERDASGKLGRAGEPRDARAGGQDKFRENRRATPRYVEIDELPLCHDARTAHLARSAHHGDAQLVVTRLLLLVSRGVCDGCVWTGTATASFYLDRVGRASPVLRLATSRRRMLSRRGERRSR